jgi:hypothetical protein
MNKKFEAIAMLAWVILSCGVLLHASTVSVGTCRPTLPHFNTIQAAVYGSAQGGTVLVCPGVYPEQVSIYHPINLKGVDSGGSNMALITMPPGGTGTQIYVQATGVYISDLTIDGSNNGATGCGQGPQGIFYSGASGTVDHVAIRNQVPTGQPNCLDGTGVLVEEFLGTPATVTIQNSSIHAFQGNGIYASGTNANVTVKGNSIGGNTVGPAGNGVAIEYGASGTVEGNTITNVIEPVSYPNINGAGWGVAVVCAQNIVISGNIITDTQAGIVVTSAPSCGANLGDGNTIVSNQISQTHIFDAVYVCGNYNLVENNTINSASEAGVNIDNQCNPGVSGYYNDVTGNKSNEACSTTLLNPALAGQNTIGSNPGNNVVYDSLTGAIPLTAGTCSYAPM